MNYNEDTALDNLYEVEVKLPLPDANAMKERIVQEGGVVLNSEYQIDAYYDHPCRSFFETDESVRVRHRNRIEGPAIEESGHAPVELTYKGPKIDKTTKTRLEYSVNLNENDIESISQILLNTGFKFVGKIVKHRNFYSIEGITISIDTVADVGSFIEFELIAEGDKDMGEAKKRIFHLVKRLGLDEKEMIRTSYLELYLQKSMTKSE